MSLENCDTSPRIIFIKVKLNNHDLLHPKDNSNLSSAVCIPLFHWLKFNVRMWYTNFWFQSSARIRIELLFIARVVVKRIASVVTKPCFYIPAPPFTDTWPGAGYHSSQITHSPSAETKNGVIAMINALIHTWHLRQCLAPSQQYKC